jgi:hypothetical protein
MGFSLWALGCGHGGAVKSRFASEFGCHSRISVKQLGAGGYLVNGCGRRAVYTCGTNRDGSGVARSLCFRESDSGSSVARAPRGPAPSRANVARKYDEKRKMKTVVGSFSPSGSVTVTLAGAPSATLGEVLVELKVAHYLTKKPCDALEVLVNAVPAAGARFSSEYQGGKLIAQARVDFQTFKPLAQKFATLGVRACGYETTLDEGVMNEVQKFFVIYSELATEASQTMQTPASTEPPLDESTKNL